MQSSHQTMTARQWALLLFLSLLWGGSFLFIRIAMEDLGPLTLVFLRTATASCVLIPVLYFRGLGFPPRPLWPSLAVLGFLNNLVPFTLLFWGEIYISAGLASILNALTPLFAVLLAHYLTQHERLTPNRILGLCCGIGGVAVLIGPGLLVSGSAQGAMQVMAEFAVVLASLSYAVATRFGRRFKEHAPMRIAAGQVTATALMSIPFALLIDHPFAHGFPVWQSWVAVGWLGVLSTALAYVIYFRLLAEAGATNLTFVTLLAPVTAVLLGWAVLHEHLLWRHFAGMALIAAGLLAIDGRLLRKLGLSSLILPRPDRR
jgi:drug/metabolite transporter (DMT)-like permease